MAVAVDNTLCVWRTRDGKSVTESFRDLITTLQWKPVQKGSEYKVTCSLVPRLSLFLFSHNRANIIRIIDVTHNTRNFSK